jgi:hypothetical protein
MRPRWGSDATGERDDVEADIAHDRVGMGMRVREP